MTNADTQANAQPAPKSDQGAHSRGPTERERQLAKRRDFELAYSRWLAARAANENPDGPEDGESAALREKELSSAEREVIFTPATLPWMVWRKFEIFGVLLEDELHTGTRADCILIPALAAIKADLISLELVS